MINIQQILIHGIYPLKRVKNNRKNNNNIFNYILTLCIFAPLTFSGEREREIENLFNILLRQLHKKYSLMKLCVGLLSLIIKKIGDHLKHLIAIIICKNGNIIETHLKSMKHTLHCFNYI